ncbi:hypothetical protein FRC09_019959, partial [Ceratobasidium sp. 395]
MVTRAEARRVQNILGDDARESDLGLGITTTTRATAHFPRKSLSGPSMWMLDAIADISGHSRAPVQSYHHRHPSNPPTPLVLMEKGFGSGSKVRRRKSSVDMPNAPQLNYGATGPRRSSLQWEPQSPSSPGFKSGWPNTPGTGTGTVSSKKRSRAKSNATAATPTSKMLRRWTRRHEESDNGGESETDSEAEENDAFERQKAIAQASGVAASRQRMKEGAPRERKEAVVEVVVPGEHDEHGGGHGYGFEEQAPTLSGVVKRFYPTVPNKALVVFGLLVSLASGAMTPIFSFLLATLMSEVAAGGRNVPLITRYALLVLLAAAGDGLTGGLKFFIMEVAAMNWVTALRDRCFERILAQDKRWHDDPAHSPVTVAQVLIKDGDDARTLVAVVLGQCVTVATMVLVGLVWAMAMGWQLTLVGIGVGPVFALVMVFQVRASGNIELKNKRAREEVAKQYYNAVANVRAIRAMAMESVFKAQFERSLE